MIILNIDQNTPEWEEMRRSKIGASDIPTLILGSDAEKYALYMRKVTGEKLHVTDAMQRGHDLEPQAREYFEMLTGRTYAKITAVHEEYPFLLASFDGWSGSRGLEIKCPGHVPESIELAKDYEKYWWQVQTHLSVSDGEEEDLLMYSDVQTPCFGTIQRDDGAISKVIEAAKEFNEYLSGAKEYPAPWEDRLDQQWFEASEALKEATQGRMEWEEREKMCREAMIYLSGEKNSRGNGVTVTRIVRRGAVEYNKIPQLKDVDLEVYRKAPIVTWRIGQG